MKDEGYTKIVPHVYVTRTKFVTFEQLRTYEYGTVPENEGTSTHCHDLFQIDGQDRSGRGSQLMVDGTTWYQCWKDQLGMFH
jgi:hypothetical protein